MKKEESDSLGASLKRAFTWHWHLLALGAAGGAAVLSGVPLLVLPFIAAGELGYLGFLGMNPRFQKVLKATGNSKLPPPLPDDPAARLQQLIAFLSREDLARFETLRDRCTDLNKLRSSMNAREGNSGVEDFRGESLDRMLWLYLKLLHQRSGLQRFLTSTEEEKIRTELQSAQAQLATSQAKDQAAGTTESRLTTSVRDRLKTIQERLENYQRATDSLELVTAEIHKTEQQITHLCEVGMTMSDSAGLSVQIDSISESLQSSEEIFADTSFATFAVEDDTPPPILNPVAQ